MTDSPRALPFAVARLVQAQKDIDIRADLVELLERGQKRVTIGIGSGVDIPLLDQELHAAEIAMLDRQVIIAAVRAEPDGYVIERGWSNFGVYVWSDDEPYWQNVPWQGSIRGLRPGDKVALGAAPAEGLRFELPESAFVAPPLHNRSERLRHATTQQRTRTPEPPAPPPPRATPPPAPTRLGSSTRMGRDPWADVTPRAHTRRPTMGQSPAPTLASGPQVTGFNASRTPSGTPGAPPPGRPMPPRPDHDKYQRRFDVAFMYWRYDKVTIGDHRFVIALDEPELQGMRVAIGRNLEHPERGYEVFVKEPAPEFWVQPAGEAVRMTRRGDVVRLRGVGNQIGFAGFVVHLVEPAIPISRFGPREEPRPEDIAEVLGVPLDRIDDAERVKSAYRDLVRRFHPDMHEGDPGHLSRFLELQTCFDAWRRTRAG